MVLRKGGGPKEMLVLTIHRILNNDISLQNSSIP